MPSDTVDHTLTLKKNWFKIIDRRKYLKIRFPLTNFHFDFLVKMPEGDVAEKKRGRPAKEDKVNSTQTQPN